MKSINDRTRNPLMQIIICPKCKVRIPMIESTNLMENIKLNLKCSCFEGIMSLSFNDYVDILRTNQKCVNASDYDINFICSEHKCFYESYCYTCSSHLCQQCLIDHPHHDRLIAISSNHQTFIGDFRTTANEHKKIHKHVTEFISNLQSPIKANFRNVDQIITELSSYMNTNSYYEEFCRYLKNTIQLNPNALNYHITLLILMINFLPISDELYMYIGFDRLLKESKENEVCLSLKAIKKECDLFEIRNINSCHTSSRGIIKPHEEELCFIFQLRYSSNGNIITASKTSIKKWESNTFKCLISVKSSWIHDIGECFNGNLIVVNNNKEVCFLNPDSLHCFQTINLEIYWIISLDNEKVLVRKRDNVYPFIMNNTLKESFGEMHIRSNEKPLVLRLTNSNIVLAYDLTVSIHREKTYEMIKSFNIQGGIRKIHETNEGNLMIFAREEISVWDMITMQLVMKMSLFFYFSGALSLNKEWIVLLNYLKGITLTSFPQMKSMNIKVIRDASFKDIEFLPNGKIITIDKDGIVHLWEL